MKRGATLKTYARLERHTPIERGAPMKRTRLRKASPRRVAERAHMRPWLAFVAKMSCAGEFGVLIPGRGWREHLCEGPIQVMHLGRKPGVGLKCPDDETGPGCMRLHMDLDQRRGPFRRLTPEEVRAWKDGVIADVRKAATPENKDHARTLEAMGLGCIVGDGTPDGWAWRPMAREVPVEMLAAAVAP